MYYYITQARCTLSLNIVLYLLAIEKIFIIFINTDRKSLEIY